MSPSPRQVKSPRLTLHWDPTPAAIRRSAEKAAKDLREGLIADLWRAGYPDDLAEMIRARVQQKGQDAKGRSFAPYSDSYKAWRAAHGLGTRPDLTVSGQMLDALQGVRVGRMELNVGFRGGHSAAGVRTAELLAWFQHGGTRPGRRRGTGFQDQRRRTGARSKGDPGGIPPRPFFGLTQSEEIAAIGVANVVFSNVTVKRMIQQFAAEAA